MQHEELVSEVASLTGYSKTIVDKAYRAYWRAVKEHISSLALKQDLSEEEFFKLKPNVNIPSIGKLYVPYDRYQSIRQGYIKYQQLKENTDATH